MKEDPEGIDVANRSEAIYLPGESSTSNYQNGEYCQY